MGMLTCVTAGAALPEWPGHLKFECLKNSSRSSSSSSSGGGNGAAAAAPMDTEDESAADSGSIGTSSSSSSSSSGGGGGNNSSKSSSSGMLHIRGDVVRVDIPPEALRAAYLDPSGEGVAGLLSEALSSGALPPDAHFPLLAKARSAAAFAAGTAGRQRGVAQRLRAMLAVVSGMGHLSEARTALETFLQSQPELTYELVDLVQVVYNAADEGCTVVPLIIQVRSFVR
jgi:hypothetical protein